MAARDERQSTRDSSMKLSVTLTLPLSGSSKTERVRIRPLRCDVPRCPASLWLGNVLLAQCYGLRERSPPHHRTSRSRSSASCRGIYLDSPNTPRVFRGDWRFD